MKKKYIIFDFDGTLVNTNRIIIDSWQACFEHFLGHRLPVETIEATFGEVLMYSISYLIPDEDVDEVVDYYRTYQNEHRSAETVSVFDGIKEVLAELRQRGCIIGVGTSRTTSSFWKFMEMFGMKDSIDEAVTMNDVEKHKPDPETINAVLLKMMAHDKEAWKEVEEEATRGGDAEIPQDVLDAAIMIGDTKFDIGCAQNAGIDSVLIGWSHYVDEDDMKAHGFEPTYRIKEPKELLDIL